MPDEQEIDPRTLCGAPDVTFNDQRHFRLHREDLTERAGPLIVVIPVFYINMVGENDEGLLTNKHWNEQTEALNLAYANRSSAVQVTFTHSPEHIAVVRDDELFRLLQQHSSPKIESYAKRAHLRAGIPENFIGLRFFTIHADGNLLGWANIPYVSRGSKYYADAAFMKWQTVPPSNLKRFNLGLTGAHEVGHWLGLWHTFQGGCGPQGDEVEDTPAHEGPNYGTPDPNDNNGACNPRERAPVKNIMNYTDDVWMNEITVGQMTRVGATIRLYRPELIVNRSAGSQTRAAAPATGASEVQVQTNVTKNPDGTVTVTTNFTF